ncbi:RelA/SpoT family protein [Candidatus Peregrinibacteria bacterium]|nr:RelA/SpoT family protein [Candidatus Peregrinibacteria bacterium]
MSTKQALLKNLEDKYGLDAMELVRNINKYNPDFNEKRFLKAYEFAAFAHNGQQRKNGEPYIIHPFATVRIMVSLRADEDTLIAALLHDVPEDTEKSIEDIRDKFGEKVAFLVEGITKLSKVQYKHDMAKRHVDSLKKMFLHTVEDPRIILIKLCDRLHNMRTLHFIDRPEKRARIARETLEIFVPIANGLGIEELKVELENLCFKHLYPEHYEIVHDRLISNNEKHKKIQHMVIEKVEDELQKNKIHATIYGRIRHLFSIYKRINQDVTRLNEYDSTIALRIIVRDIKECYHVLGIIHSMFRQKPGVFKDYISNPKRNGYQSLHTTVFGLEGVYVEFQIRTHKMHIEAEYGIAASYYFDESKKSHKQLTKDERANWISKIIQTEKESETGEENFIDDLKDDYFHDRIFVFTPKGDVIDLPKNASAVDLAYEIHTEVGHRAIKAEINGRPAPITTRLKSSDIVNIVTSDMQRGPNRSWLEFVKTNSAKNKILAYLKRQTKYKKIETGDKLLQKELDRAGLGLIKDIPSKKIKDYNEGSERFKSIEDIKEAIGEGSLRPRDYVEALFPHKDNVERRKKNLFEKLFYGKPKDFTVVNIKIVSRDAVGQLKKILNIMAELDLSVLRTSAYLSLFKKDFVCKLKVCVKNFSQVSIMCENLEHIEGVKKVTRSFWKRKLYFGIIAAATVVFWSSHPYVMYQLLRGNSAVSNNFYVDLMLYLGVISLFVVVGLVLRIARRSFPGLRATTLLWILSYALSIFAIVTFLAEIYFFGIEFNSILLGGLISIILIYLIIGYFGYRRKIKNQRAKVLAE